MLKSDSELWELVLKNDNSAWRALILKYQSLVYAVLTRSGLSMSDAGDCFQQVWYLLLKNKNKIKQPERLAAWLVTTSKREAQQVRKKTKVTIEINEMSNLVDSGTLPDEQLIKIQQQAILENSLKRLDSRCQKLLQALFYAPEDYSYKKIAQELNISINSLGATRQRCLEKLKTLLNKNI